MHCYKILARAPAREPDTHANVKINLMHPHLDIIFLDDKNHTINASTSSFRTPAACATFLQKAVKLDTWIQYRPELMK